jgi:hypothetical protein
LLAVEAAPWGFMTKEEVGRTSRRLRDHNLAKEMLDSQLCTLYGQIAILVKQQSDSISRACVEITRKTTQSLQEILAIEDNAKVGR